MGGINFGWLAVWVPSPDWLCRKLEICDVCQALRWSRRAWGTEVWAVPRLCIEYPGICLTTEEKSRKNLGQGNRRALDWSAPNAIHLVELAIAGDGLDWPAVHCRPWLSRQATGWLGECNMIGYLSPPCTYLGTAVINAAMLLPHLSNRCRCGRGTRDALLWNHSVAKPSKLKPSACNTGTTQTQPHQISNTQRTENKTTAVVIQQHSRKLLMMDTLMSETCWAHKKWNV